MRIAGKPKMSANRMSGITGAARCLIAAMTEITTVILVSKFGS